MLDALAMLIQNNSLMLAVMGLGFWRVLLALHRIDRRLVRVETKLAIKGK